MKHNIEKIAIVRLSALGDIINSAIVLQFIKAAYPHATITWIAQEPFGNILKSAKYLDNVLMLDLKSFKHQKSLSLLKAEIKKLKLLGSFDIVIDMQGLIKSAIVARLLSKRCHGFDKKSTRESLAALLYKTKSSIPYEANVILRNTKVVADALDIKINKNMIEEKEPIFHQNKTFSLSATRHSVAFVIGASWPSKIYPKEHIVQICAALDVDAYIIWGNENELYEAKWIVSHATNAKLAPKCSLEELVSFISQMDLLIGNDTGPTHIAWAQNIPSITLLGPTTTRMIYETKKNIGIKSPSRVNILKINKNDFSIKDIQPQEVIKKAKELVDGI
jgi:heptosyltransferase-1